MSGWERARALPWDRIPRTVDGTELDQERERIFRRIQRESIEEELLAQEQHLKSASSGIIGDAGVDSFGENGNSSNNNQPNLQQQQQQQGSTSSTTTTTRRYQFSTMQLLRQAAFGGCLGSITGGAFGFMDGMRTAGESAVLKKASPVAQGKYLMESTRRSATLFGLMFMGFQVGKYAIRVVGNDPGDVPEIVGSGIVTLGTLSSRPTWRAAVPYAVMLMGMDSFHAYTRHTDNTGSRPT